MSSVINVACGPTCGALDRLLRANSNGTDFTPEILAEGTAIKELVSPASRAGAATASPFQIEEYTEMHEADQKGLEENVLTKLHECGAICQDELCGTPNAWELPCGHGFHEDCLEPWFMKHTNCPTCRTEVTFEALEQKQDLRSMQQAEERLIMQRLAREHERLRRLRSQKAVPPEDGAEACSNPGNACGHCHLPGRVLPNARLILARRMPYVFPTQTRMPSATGARLLRLP